MNIKLSESITSKLSRLAELEGDTSDLSDRALSLLESAIDEAMQDFPDEDEFDLDSWWVENAA